MLSSIRARKRTGGRSSDGSQGFSDSVAGVSSCTSQTTGRPLAHPHDREQQLGVVDEHQVDLARACA